VADGLMITIGGVLLLTPGFITDAVGLLLLLPPTRAIARRLLRSYVSHRMVVVGADGMRGARSSDPASGRDYDFESTAEEIDGDDPRLPR
ncbi:MAG TPA: FxsA family protein, partial [Coriobacteriia bacterium]|nr:FxsA family protein [Coriobacteriia bacterium]